MIFKSFLTSFSHLAWGLPNDFLKTYRLQSADSLIVVKDFEFPWHLHLFPLLPCSLFGISMLCSPQAGTYVWPLNNGFTLNNVRRRLL
jgi:hypothetical protein